MTLTRILTALVLIPAVVAIVLFTPTWAVALATAAVTILALREYFVLGEAIGHRAYRLWTIFSALLLIFFQGAEALGRALTDMHIGFTTSVGDHKFAEDPSLACVFFLFVLGLTVLTLFTLRPLVESLPSAGISSSAFLLVAFPLSYA